ncbi:major facilitator superfamily domain-containing protein [Suillus discolor]|uniref:Major facilitator superfamily domain-containing protein n=1 Tax=Suillus discolor TaxID=1912936 RepID=A0A9P7JZU5_9AGAM|nr:major facilitator superfamily domain-containing protein [Suillus discolor]KAG2118702.1 major facilitator superfamily domain-containing protein [Suillus discolor]
MATESEPRTVYAEETRLQEDKGHPEVFEECQATKDWDHPSNPPEFLEGGWAGWATAVGAFLVQFCGIGYTASFGVYQGIAPDKSEHETFNILLSRLLYSTLPDKRDVVCYIMDWEHNRFFRLDRGPRGRFATRPRIFLPSHDCRFASGGFLSIHAISVETRSVLPDFSFQGLGLGIAVGLTYVPSVAVISHHFQQRRTLVMTFIAIGASLGAIIHPIILNNLLNGPLGFANGVRVSAGLISLFLLTACLCMRTRHNPPATPVNSIVGARKCIRDVPFMLMVTGSFLFQIVFYYPLFFFQLDSIKHSISIDFSFYSLVILNGANCLGRFTSGFIASFTGGPELNDICDILMRVVVLGMVYGYISGLSNAMGAPLMALLTPDLSELGARMGICFFALGFASLIGTPICGALLTSSYTWWVPALFSGIVSLAGSMMFIFMRYTFLRKQRVQIDV